MLDEYEVVLFAHWIDLHEFQIEKQFIHDDLKLIAITLKYQIYAEESLENF
jgi:hypothetical protein